MGLALAGELEILHLHAVQITDATLIHVQYPAER